MQGIFSTDTMGNFSLYIQNLGQKRVTGKVADGQSNGLIDLKKEIHTKH